MVRPISEEVTQQEHSSKNLQISPETHLLEVFKMWNWLLLKAAFKTTIFFKKYTNKFIENLGQYV